ncbi:lipopolysaccharide kinase InaA family protein [Sulfurimonas sp.]|uniref:lipopolysaccharide kinase InaA family protein n=1 Tax=Sulfurimonas sp. TaxID=2022749 RepID=UPI002601CCAB|nr:lipopolysaccharide kinase InaA family protein [Sulfurimonas sp.]
MNQIVYAYIRNSKAKKSYLNAIELIKLSISTPKPIGYIEFYRYKLFKESFYVSEFVEYNFTIREPLRNKTLKNREKIIKEFVRFTYNLHQKGVFHKDFSAGNTLVIIKEDSYDFSIVDINRLELKTITLDLAMKNFDKLWLDEDTLIFIAKEYAKLSGYNEEECINKIIFYDKKLKDFVQKRRKIKKGIFGK